MPRQQPEIVVVGAGFSGAVVARSLADAGHRVRIIERRGHIGGNAYDDFDAHGILVHRHGPHLFHTNSARVFDYLGRFTAWRPYEHRVLSSVGGKLLPVPINLDTINGFFGLDLTEAEAAAHLARIREPRDPVLTSEDVVVNAVGRDLYEAMFRNYTRKQWGLDPSALDASVAARIPVRTSRDDRYFTDSYQAMPADGYSALFRRMLDHPAIAVECGVDFFTVRDRLVPRHLIYTGPVDGFFGHVLGRLPYRSLRFEHEHVAGTGSFQPAATVNYPNEHAFTRITEFRKITGQAATGTSIVREYPQAEGEPYYPVPNPANQALHHRYRALARAEEDVTFVGRLAEYRYYNMDQAVGSALKVAGRLVRALS